MTPNRKTLWFPILSLLLAVLHVQAMAHETDAVPEEALDVPEDEFDRGTPKRTTEGFLSAIDIGDYERAAEYLDLRFLQGEASELDGAELARRLFVVARRAEWIDIDERVDDPAGRADDNLPEYRDSIGVILVNGNEIRLYLQRVPREDGVSIWKVSNATVSQIPALYRAYGYPKIVEDLRLSLPQGSFLGFEFFQWVIVTVVGVLIYGVVFLAAFTIRRILGDADTPSHKRIFRFLVLPFGIWALIVSLNAVAAWLGRGVSFGAWHSVSPIPILITVWMVFGAINLLREVYANRLAEQNRPGTAVLLRPAGNALKALIFVAATLIYLDKIGVNITTMLAGLGVGGVAVALALQKPMEDVFGAFTLYTQQPIKVGDFCNVGGEIGIIEEIGLRTTRIRTLADSVIAMPNAKLANEPIDNFSARKKTRYRPTLRLRFDTSPEQITQILENIRELFRSHPRILQERHHVRFKEIGEDALLVEGSAYLDTVDWAEYLGLAEELNIKILEIVAGSGTSLAFPSRTLHLEKSASIE